MINKPTMVAGVSTGVLGTIRAQIHLRQILVSRGVQADVLPPGINEIVINLAGQKFDESSGRLVDENTLQFLDEVIERFVEFIRNKP